MRIEITVASRGAERDLAVQAPGSVAFSQLLPGLSRAVDAGDGATAWLDGAPLRPAATLAESGLRTGSVLTFDRGPRRPDGAAVLSLAAVGGPAAGSVVPLERGRLYVGRADDNDLVLADPDVSRRHAAFDVTTTSITVYDLDSTNGTSVDGQRVPPEGLAIRLGALISMGDSVLVVDGPVDAPATLQPAEQGGFVVLPPPRRRHIAPDREIAVPARPTWNRPRGVQWLTMSLPAAAGGAVAWWSHSAQFLLFALMSPAMMLSTALGDRIHWRRSRRRQAASYRRRRADAEREIAAGLAAEAVARRAIAPDPACVLRQATLPGSRLWERRRTDPDALQLRLGTAQLDSRLKVRTGSAVIPAGTLDAVPLCVDLRRGPLGVAGPPEIVTALGRWLVGQLAALHSPADLEIGLLVSGDRTGAWQWARWLPHLGARVAAHEDEWNPMVAGLTAMVDQRLAERRLDPDGWRGRWLVLVVDRAGRLAEVPGLAGLLERGAAVGLTAVIIDTAAGNLPATCVGVVRVSGMTGTRVLVRPAADSAETEVVADQVSEEWADRLARALAPLVDGGAADSSSVPSSCGLLDVLGIGQLEPATFEARWASADGGARGALGRSADGVLELDLAAQGPHALVAGTTGAGKSELLQTLVAGLAANHPPDELTFVLIDYKGGAAFADCARLPHTAGLVTDLDPYLTERALRALNSELRSRERAFAAAGVSDLAAYRACRASPGVPRLIIVVDEFAALAEELPEFVHGLIGVAQRGRSLGVHLVLATQRPGTAVSAEIRANTSLRIALRVTDPAESADVIDSPDAALIEHSCPGRGYLRAGQELTCFQVAHAAGHTASDRGAVSIERLGPWRRAVRRAVRGEAFDSDLARLVGVLRTTAERTGRRPARSPWLEPLPDALPRCALPNPPGELSVPIGVIDLPDEQRRGTLSVDLATGASLLVAGTARSGRTSALASIALGAAERLDPDRLHVHVVDGTGALVTALRTLPHAATVLGPQDVALLPRLLSRLAAEAARRAAGNVGPAAPPDRPALLLLVDGWENVCAALPDLDAAACSESLAGLLRLGPAAGVSVAVTGERSVLAPRFAGGFAERVLLRLSDRSDYGLAGIPFRAVPGTLPAGRGLRTVDGTLVQLAHAGEQPGAAGARSAVAAAAARWGRRAGQGPHAILVRPLPTRVELGGLPAPAGKLALGLAGDRLDPVALDLFAGAGRLLVAGPPRSGRTTVLRLLARQAAAAGIAMLVAATSRSALAEDARRLAVPVVGPAEPDVGPAPVDRTLLLVDDCELFTDSAAGNQLTSWARSVAAPLAVVVAGRSDDLATSFRGIAAEVRRSRCGILLRPGPVDGELLGVRLPRRPSSGPPGRGVAIGDPSWGPLFEDGEPVPIQVATP